MGLGPLPLPTAISWSIDGLNALLEVFRGTRSRTTWAGPDQMQTPAQEGPYKTFRSRALIWRKASLGRREIVLTRDMALDQGHDLFV